MTAQTDKHMPSVESDGTPYVSLEGEAVARFYGPVALFWAEAFTDLLDNRVLVAEAPALLKALRSVVRDASTHGYDIASPLAASLAEARRVLAAIEEPHT